MFRFPTQQQNMKTLIEIQEEQRKLEEEKQRKQQQTQAKVNGVNYLNRVTGRTKIIFLSLDTVKAKLVKKTCKIGKQSFLLC